MDNSEGFPCYTKDNKIIVEHLHNNNCAHSFLRCVKKLVSKGVKYIIIDFTTVSQRHFPNACVPIAAIIDYYKSEKVQFKAIDSEEHPVIKKCDLLTPLIGTKEIMPAHNVLGKIWKFKTSQNVNEIADEIVLKISESVEYSDGVIDSLNWFLYEIMDNVLMHSNYAAGFIMLQYHPQTKIIAICVTDTGVGVLQTLKHTKYKPATSIDAITLAVKEGVTRDKSIGQGNGLYGLLEIVRQNKGRLEIESGNGEVCFRDAENITTKKIPCINFGNNAGMLINVQINAGEKINLIKALKKSNKPITMALENLTSDSGEELNIIIKKHSHGHGTRAAGREIRNLIRNIINTQKINKITLDFKGIALMSSSFADEFVGKLVAYYGFIKFQRMFSIINTNDLTQTILDKVVESRLKQGSSEDILN